MSRSPNLSGEVVAKIAAAVTAMEEPAAWTLVIAAAERVTGAAYTRQALSKHPRIIAAFRCRRHGHPADAGGRAPSRSARARQKALEADAAEIRSLREAVWRYEELMILVMSNAYLLNIREDQLLKPLSACDSSLARVRRTRAPGGAIGRSRQ